MDELDINIWTYWQTEDANCEPCFLCEDMIFSKVNRLIFVVGNKKELSKICLCNSCYNEL